MSIEKDVEDPHSSPLFQEVPRGRQRSPRHRVHHRLPAHDGLGQPERARDRVADGQRDRNPSPRSTRASGRHHSAWPGGLPAFGIVAAVLGVVKTMGSVGQPPAVLGAMIGSALVGTFLGILLAYAVAEPLAGLLEQKVEEGGKEFQCIKTTLLASMQGYAPQVAIEFGRKVLLSGGAPHLHRTRTACEGQEVNEPPSRRRRRPQSDAADLAPPGRQRRPPGGEAAAGRIGGG